MPCHFATGSINERSSSKFTIKGIKSNSLTGGIRSEEMIDLLDNRQYGDYKFLLSSYVSIQRIGLTAKKLL
jgi:hypothetical protein